MALHYHRHTRYLFVHVGFGATLTCVRIGNIMAKNTRPSVARCLMTQTVALAVPPSLSQGAFTLLKG